MPEYFVRVGSLAEVHSATATQELIRGQRVILRTQRGVELGEVIATDTATGNAVGDSAITDRIRIARPTTAQDEMLIRRLEKHKTRAIERCRQALVDAGSTSVLLDVDLLFDGATIVMHFLGKIDNQAEVIANEIARKYESIVGLRKLVKQLTEGCGPDCGTSNSGCGDSCGSCSLASACNTSKKNPD